MAEHANFLGSMAALPMLLLLARLLAGVVGALLMCVLVLDEAEEETIQEHLINWWIRIDDASQRSISRGTAFLRGVVETTLRAFSLLFGERLLGPKAAAASICYSQVGLLIGLMALSPLNFHEWSKEEITRGLLIPAFAILGSLGPYIKSTRSKLVWLATAMLVATVHQPMTAYIDDATNALNIWGGPLKWTIGWALLAAVGSDFLFIALTRAILRRARSSKSFIVIAALLIGNATVGISLAYIPIWYALNTEWDSMPAAFTITFFGCSNIIDALVGLAALLFGIAILAQRTFWPTLARPLYAMQRNKIFMEHKKLVFFAGVTLFTVALPALGQFIRQVATDLKP